MWKRALSLTAAEEKNGKVGAGEVAQQDEKHGDEAKKSGVSDGGAPDNSRMQGKEDNPGDVSAKK